MTLLLEAHDVSKDMLTMSGKNKRFIFILFLNFTCKIFLFLRFGKNTNTIPK